MIPEERTLLWALGRAPAYALELKLAGGLDLLVTDELVAAITDVCDLLNRSRTWRPWSAALGRRSGEFRREAAKALCRPGDHHIETAARDAVSALQERWCRSKRAELLETDAALETLEELEQWLATIRDQREARVIGEPGDAFGADVGASTSAVLISWAQRWADEREEERPEDAEAVRRLCALECAPTLEQITAYRKRWPQ